MDNNVTSARYLYKSDYFYTSLSHVLSIFAYWYRDLRRFTSRIIISQVSIAIVTRSLVCVLTELRKTAHYTTYSTKQRNLRNFPTSYRIRYLLRNAYQHSPTYRRRRRSSCLAATWVLTCFFFYSRHKFIRLSHFEFHLYRSVYFTDPFLFNCTSTPHSSASFPTDNCRASLHTSILHLFSSIPDNFAICTTQ